MWYRDRLHQTARVVRVELTRAPGIVFSMASSSWPAAAARIQRTLLTSLAWRQTVEGGFDLLVSPDSAVERFAKAPWNVLGWSSQATL